MKTQVHGVLLIDKPSHCTSHDVVARVRKILNISTVGHAGTLDPIASGLLVVLVGEATKLSDYLLNGEKGYRVRFQLGLETDSDDITGKILRELNIQVSPEMVLAAISQHTGELELPPPLFSAVKVNGKKMYEAGRKQRALGEYNLTQLKSRPMSFYNIAVKEIDGNFVTVEMTCSKGSYIRSWVRAIGQSLSSGATVVELRRICSSPFKVSDSVSLETLSQVDLNKIENHKFFVGLADVLSHWTPVAIREEDERSVRNGQISKHLFNDLLRRFPNYEQAPQGLRVLSQASGKLISVFLKQPGQGYRIKRVFNY